MTEFSFLGRRMKSYGDLVSMMGKLYKDQDKTVADAFLVVYGEAIGDAELAKKNIGFLCGEFTFDEMAKMEEFFGVKHPSLSGVKTPMDAFERGVEIGAGRG